MYQISILGQYFCAKIKIENEVTVLFMFFFYFKSKRNYYNCGNLLKVNSKPKRKDRFVWDKINNVQSLIYQEPDNDRIRIEIPALLFVAKRGSYTTTCSLNAV